MCISALSRLSHKNFNFKPYTFGKTSSKGNTNTVSNGSNNTVFFQHFCTKNPKASTPFLVHEPQSLKICGLPESQGSPANCLK